jgi:hypothetical protein
MGSGMVSGVGSGNGRRRQQLLLKWMGAPAFKANANGNGMDEDSEGPKIKSRKIQYLLLHFMPLLPPTLLSLCPCSHASYLPWLVAVLPLVLRRLAADC